MSIIQLLVVLAVIGIILAFVPMESRIKTIIVIVVAVAVCIWLLSSSGLVTSSGLIN